MDFLNESLEEFSKCSMAGFQKEPMDIYLKEFLEQFLEKFLRKYLKEALDKRLKKSLKKSEQPPEKFLKVIL